MVIFGRELASQDRSAIKKLDLKNRRFLGPTSMDAELALLMANFARIKKGSLVMDPFVGTGSILLAASYYGAYTFGMDIDYKIILYGKKDKKGSVVNFWTNFEDYKLKEPLDVIRGDLHTLPFREDIEELYDAIIGDPPYGVRAGAKKSVSKDVQIHDKVTHIASTDTYQLSECIWDLLDFAAKSLKLGGRLVYFMPCIPQMYSDKEILLHPQLKLISNCEQPLQAKYSRRLVTMEKIKQYNHYDAQVFQSQVQKIQMSVDGLHDVVFDTHQDLSEKLNINGDSIKQKAIQFGNNKFQQQKHKKDKSNQSHYIQNKLANTYSSTFDNDGGTL